MFLGNFRSVRKNNNPNKQNEKKETLILLFSLSRKKCSILIFCGVTKKQTNNKRHDTADNLC